MFAVVKGAWDSKFLFYLKLGSKHGLSCSIPPSSCYNQITGFPSCKIACTADAYGRTQWCCQNSWSVRLKYQFPVHSWEWHYSVMGFYWLQCQITTQLFPLAEEILKEWRTCIPFLRMDLQSSKNLACVPLLSLDLMLSWEESRHMHAFYLYLKYHLSLYPYLWSNNRNT